MDVINLYDGSTAAVAYTMPARAVAINCLTGISALLDVIRCYFGNAARDALVRSHKNTHGQGSEFKVAASPFWEEFKRYDLEAQEWFGMGNMCHNMSFNVLGVERDEPAEISRKNHNLQLWILWRNNIAGRNMILLLSSMMDAIHQKMKWIQGLVVPVLDYDLPGIQERAQSQAHPRHQRRSQSRSRSQCQKPRQEEAT